MSDYLLLTDPERCPKCRCKAVPKSVPARCRACGMQLFKATDAIRRFEEETGWREYWVFSGNQEGWKHRTQIFDPNPLSRVVKEKKIEDDYGTQEFTNKKLANSRIELKEALKKTKYKGKKIK